MRGEGRLTCLPSRSNRCGGCGRWSISSPRLGFWDALDTSTAVPNMTLGRLDLRCAQPLTGSVGLRSGSAAQLVDALAKTDRHGSLPQHD